MKDQAENDSNLRKSKRQRVPNSFYTEGINELKRAPRPPRDPQPKQSQPRKRSRVFEENEDHSGNQDVPSQERSEQAQENGWYPCLLPKSGSLLKVQFLLSQPDDHVVEKKRQKEKEKEEPKPVKKNQSSFDLLSLFQMAIQNVNDQGETVKPIDNQLIVLPKVKKEQSFVMQKRTEDLEGKIISVNMNEGRLLISHSKHGESEVPFDNSSLQIQSNIDKQLIEQYREKLMSSTLLSQISIFN